jgi:hypothetical protein
LTVIDSALIVIDRDLIVIDRDLIVIDRDLIVIWSWFDRDLIVIWSWWRGNRKMNAAADLQRPSLQKRRPWQPRVLATPVASSTQAAAASVGDFFEIVLDFSGGEWKRAGYPPAGKLLFLSIQLRAELDGSCRSSLVSAAAGGWAVLDRVFKLMTPPTSGEKHRPRPIAHVAHADLLRKELLRDGRVRRSLTKLRTHSSAASRERASAVAPMASET